MSEFVIKRNDLSPSLRMRVTNPDTTAFDFTGYTQPVFIMRLPGVGTPKVSKPGAIEAGGYLRYDWAAGDTDVDGTFKCEFQVLDPAGKKRTFPNGGYGVVRVVEDLNDLTDACVCELVPNPGTPDRAIVVYSAAAGGTVIQQDATIDDDGKLFAVGADFSADVAIVGDIALSGTVDGRDVSADGTTLDALEVTVAGLEAGDIALEGRVTAAESAIATLDTRVDTHDGAIAALGAADTGLDARLDALEGVVPQKAEQSALEALALVTWASVPSIAALQLQPVSHKVVFVDSVRDFFVYRAASGLTVDNITITPALGGVGRWERLGLGHPSWDTQTAWYIDTGVGDDEADGTAAVAGGGSGPIKTWAELIRRLGVQHVARVVTTITITGNLPASDPMIGEWRVINGGRVNVMGVATQVFTGTISARQSLNTATNLECQATSSWTVATHLNRLVINSTRGLSAWIAKDLGGGNARVSPWMLYNETTGSVGPTTGNSEVGDTVNVYTLPTVACMQFEVRGTAGSTSPLVFSRLDFTASGGTQRFFGANAQPQFVNCRISGNTRFGAGLQIFTNCWWGADGGYAIDYAAYLRICGGLMTVNWASSISRPGGNTFELRNSVLFQGAALNSSAASFINVQAADFRDVAGNPLTIQHGSFLAINGPLTGAGNTGTSLIIAPASRGTYVPSTLLIASAGGDVQVGGTARTFAQLPYVEGNNGALLVAA